MTTTFLLVRHAEHEVQGKVLVGRMNGIDLSADGRVQARKLGRALAGSPCSLIQSSPLPRAQQTAQAIAQSLNLPVETADALSEIDFGAWTGQGMEALESDPGWQDWNRDRAAARAPSGESMQEVQARICNHLDALCASHPEQHLILISHGDVIKAALLRALNMGLNDIHRFDTDPASISIIAQGDWGAKVLGLNQRIAA